MSTILRVLLLTMAIAAAVWILYKIRKLKVKMEDAIFWVIFAVILCVMGIFPKVTYWMTEKLGMMSPANLIFLVVIFLLAEKIFTLSILISQLEDKVSILSTEVALRNHSAERRLKAGEKAMEEAELVKKTDSGTECDRV